MNLVCLESLEEMPADSVEILEGQEEGIFRHNSWGPKEVLVNERNRQKFVRGVRVVRCIQVYDENKRFAPKFDETGRGGKSGGPSPNSHTSNRNRGRAK